jgi:peroxiredoxin Q/BCP
MNQRSVSLPGAGGVTLLVFYPGDDTSVCTAQLCEYRDGIEAFQGLDTDVVGINADSLESHKKFREKHSLPFTLLVDSDMKVADAYDCKALMGMKRGVYLIDETGVIRYRHVEALSVFRRSRAELIQAIKALGAQKT